ncbi:MAG: S1 RNA-binding domain-containing protein [Thermoguttaceae bacterium]
MAFTDPSNQTSSTEALEGPAENQPSNSLPSADEAAAPACVQPDSDAEGPRRQILIGSQRDPAAYRARQRRDWKPIDDQQSEKQNRGRRDRQAEERKPNEIGLGTSVPSQVGSGQSAVGNEEPAVGGRQSAVGSEESAVAVETEPPTPKFKASAPAAPRGPRSPGRSRLSAADLISELAATLGNAGAPLPRPSVRDKLSPEMEDELDRAMGSDSMDALLDLGAKGDQATFEPESLQSGRVAAIRRDDVFVEFGGREQGIVSLRLFDVPPQVGTQVQVLVQRLNPEDGLYELSLPNKAIQVDDWSDLAEGMLVDVRVTGHNTGGLECEVNHIRGFIPVSQIALHRVEDLAQFVEQRFTCLITEANPERRNLVLSRRAILEREQEAARQQMLASLRPGQIFDGVVRKLMDFGAFVDLGSGVDGLLHISQLAWGRVKHPSDVLKEGQAIKVRVEKINPDTGKISLAYRDLQESPWTAAASKYPPNTVARGKVTKLMDFGAFVEVEPGVEGLVHISELSHKRVFRCSDVVKEGQDVEVMVLSVDAEARRMSLSMKELSAPPEPEKKEEPAEAAATKPKKSKPSGPLLGGIGRKTGDKYGLKW